MKSACVLTVPVAAVSLVLLAALAGCKGQADPAKGLPPPEVAVVTIAPVPVTINDEYVAQTEAPDTIEIRTQVAGLLERQAFADGALVRKGEVLYVIDQRPFQVALAQAQANLAQAQANFVNTRQKLERYKALLAQKFVSQLDYDSTLAADSAAAAAVDAQRALVRAAEINLDFTVIRASRDGFMSKSLVKPGAIVKVQETLLNTLYSSDPMYVYFSVSEARLANLAGLLKRPQGESSEKAPTFHIRLIDGSEYNLSGRLNFVDAALDEKTGTLRTRLSIPNPERVLRPGQFVRVIVPALEKPDAIRVPQKAVQEQQGLKQVLVVDKDGKAALRQIEAQYRIANDWVVDKGLAAGEVVIVEGTQKVRPGMPVKPVMAGTAPAAGTPAGPPGSPPAAPGASKQG
jgi:membrane fusion protein (multidrug efflux system)